MKMDPSCVETPDAALCSESGLESQIKAHVGLCGLEPKSSAYRSKSCVQIKYFEKELLRLFTAAKLLNNITVNNITVNNITVNNITVNNITVNIS